MKAACWFPYCESAAQKGPWCKRHFLLLERNAASRPFFDGDGEGDAVCIFCFARAPFRDGRFTFHESHLTHQRCAGVGRSALRSGNGRRLADLPQPEPGNP
ncbi:MAG: hypothetical protein ACRD4T_00020 [Candidatus Acidiferrales bacterium]